MCRIEISIAVNRMVCTPPCLRKTLLTKFNTATLGLFTIIEFDIAKIMLITRLHMNQFSKHALSYHI